MPRICAIVLAAGRSRRMGAPKLLLPLAGRPIITHVVDQIVQSGVDRVVVVVSPDNAPIRTALENRSVQYCVNLDPDAEMLTSIRCGLRTVPTAWQGVMLCPGDQPRVPAEAMRDLIRHFRQTPQGIVVPVHDGRRGHPILFEMKYRSEILKQHDGIGLRGLLLAHPNEVVEVAVSAPGVIEDLDRPEDYRALTGMNP